MILMKCQQWAVPEVAQAEVVHGGPMGTWLAANTAVLCRLCLLVMSVHLTAARAESACISRNPSQVDTTQ